MYLIRQLKDWLKTSQAAKTSFYFLVLLSLLIFSTQSNQVLAQETEGTFPFPTPEGDLSIKLIGKIFGGLVEIIGGVNGGDPFGGAIGAFNAAVLALGGILAAYTIFAGTVGTAHDGEMMGKKFSSAWVPIRTAIGSALVLPVFGGGYCTMQAIVMWLVFQGVGLADVTWNAYVLSSSGGGGAYQTIPTAPSVQNLANNVFLASVCTKAINEASNKVGTTKLIPGGWGVHKNIKTRSIEFGTNERYTDEVSLCGKVFFGSASGTTVNLDSNVILPKTIGPPLPAPPPSRILNITQPKMIAEAQEKATDALVAAMQPIADKIIANIDVSPIEIEATAVAYQKTIINAARAMQQEAGANPFDDVVKNSSNQGWFLAGAWYMRIVNACNKISTAVQALPISSAASSKMDPKAPYYQDASPALYRAEKVIGATREAQRQGITNNSTADQPGSRAFEGITNSVTEGLAGVNLDELNKNKSHPIIIMNNMGNALITTSISLFGTAVLAGAWAGAGATIGTNVVLIFLPVLTIVGGALIGSGFMLSYYIPMVPFLIWIGAALGWVILVVEAIIAAPLWAVMHLHPHGDDLTGKGGGGYMLVLGLLIRPVLMIFGLIASLTIVQVFGEMLNNVYYDSLNIANDGTGQVFGIIFGVVIYVALMTTFIQKSFSVIHVIPDQLLKWIGGGSEQLGQYAGEFNKSGQGAATALGGVAGSRIGSEVANAGQKYRSNALQGENNKINKEAKEQSASRASAEMDEKVYGKSEALKRAEDAGKASGGEKGGKEAKEAEAGRFAQLGRMGGNEAEMDYAKRTKEATSKGKTQGEATSEAYDKTREDSLVKEFGKPGAAWINSCSGNGKDAGEERKAMDSARRVVGIAQNQNNAQETFQQANEKENLSDKKNYINDIINNGALAKTEEKAEENKSNDTESDSTSFPEIDSSFFSPGANPSLFSSGSTGKNRPDDGADLPPPFDPPSNFSSGSTGKNGPDDTESNLPPPFDAPKPSPGSTGDKKPSRDDFDL